MKKLTLALATIGLGSSLSVSAALFTGNDQSTVSVPSLKGGFEVGVTGVYFDTNYARNHLAIRDTSHHDTSQPNGDIIDVGYDYTFGWGANLGYIFPNTGNDIRLTYFQINTDDDESARKPHHGRLWTLSTHPDDDYQERVYKAHGDIEFDNYTVDLEFGQRINVGCRLSLRVFAGVSYTDLEKEFHVKYRDHEEDEHIIEKNKFESEFWGIGPKVGIDSSFALGGGFGIVARAAVAAYIGELDTKTDITNLTFGHGFDKDSADAKLDDSDHVVTALDLKIGLDYSYQMNSGSVVALEGGYWAKHYYDAVGNIQFISDHHDAMNDYQLDDVSFHGVYLSLNYSA